VGAHVADRGEAFVVGLAFPFDGGPCVAGRSISRCGRGGAPLPLESAFALPTHVCCRRIPSSSCSMLEMRSVHVTSLPTCPLVVWSTYFFEQHMPLAPCYFHGLIDLRRTPLQARSLDTRGVLVHRQQVVSSRRCSRILEQKRLPLPSPCGAANSAGVVLERACENTFDFLGPAVPRDR